MTSSILDTVKKMNGIDPSYTAFDVDLIVDINTSFAILGQMGMQPSAFTISDASSTWGDYVMDPELLPLIKTFVSSKVRTMFDPPTSGNVNESLNKILDEVQWRIFTVLDHGTF